MFILTKTDHTVNEMQNKTLYFHQMIFSFALLGKTMMSVPVLTDIILFSLINSLLVPIGKVLVNTAWSSSYFNPHKVTSSHFGEYENTET